MGGFISNQICFEIEKDKEITGAKMEAILSKKNQRVQVNYDACKISDEGWRRLNSNAFGKNPELNLRIYHATHLDLSFLRHLSNVENLSIEADEVINEEMIGCLKNLKSLIFFVKNQHDLEFLETLNLPIEELYIGTDDNKTRKIDISPITSLTNLKALTIERYNKDIANVVNQFPALEKLSLRSVNNLENVEFITKLSELRKLELSYCTIGDYSSLHKMNHLKALIMSRASMLGSIDFISQMSSLQYLYLQSVNIPTVFPEIEKLTRLKKIVLYATRSLCNLESIRHSSSLREFIFYDIKKQQIENFDPIFENKYIERIHLWSFQSGYRKRLDNRMQECGKTNEVLNYLDDLEFEYD